MIGRLRTVLNELEKIPARRLPPRYQQVSRLIEYYQRGRLVLVLGAGVSSDHGLPSWNTLLQKLLLSTIMREKLETAEMSQVLARIYTELFSPNPLVAARYLYNFYRRSEATDPMAFERAIREA
ncbi:MAG TPA: hypothetical protein VF570_06495, partial [Pyrinomonadaceae bacterium]